MYFSPSLIVAILGTPYLALAQGSSSGPNPFNVPMSGISATAGQSLTLTWKPTTQGTVSLLLRSGNSGDLTQGQTIASSIPNSGSYTWNVPSSAVRGSSYTVEIVDDSDSSQVNYTPQFVLDSSNLASSSASSSGSATSSGLTTSTSGASSSASSHASSSSGSSASSASSTSGSHSSSATGTMTSTASGSSSSQASSTSQQSGLVASGNPSPSSSHSNGGSARATVAAGMLGMVALGALAL